MLFVFWKIHKFYDLFQTNSTYFGWVGYIVPVREREFQLSQQYLVKQSFLIVSAPEIGNATSIIHQQGELDAFGSWIVPQIATGRRNNILHNLTALITLLKVHYIPARMYLRRNLWHLLINSPFWWQLQDFFFNNFEKHKNYNLT